MTKARILTCIRLLLAVSLLASSVPAWTTTTSSNIFASHTFGAISGVAALQVPNGLTIPTSRRRLHHLLKKKSKGVLCASSSSEDGHETEGEQQGEAPPPNGDTPSSTSELNKKESSKSILGRLRGGISFKLPPENERKKMVPLAIMFFCILFNYTILRSTKDVLVR